MVRETTRVGAGRDAVSGSRSDRSAEPRSERAESARIGIVTVSDRAHRGEYEDRGGPAVHAYLSRVLASPWQAHARLVPDDVQLVRATLLELVDQTGCCLVITTGGTGPAPRDTTPEATVAVVEKELPGIGEAMRAASRRHVPTAVLSRQIAGVRGSALIVNLPGSPNAVRQCLDAIFAAVPDCVDLIGGPYLRTDPSQVIAWRPHR